MIAILPYLLASVFAIAPNPNDTSIAAIVSGGTGCPSDTAFVKFDADLSTFDLIFDNFVVTSGNGTSPVDYRQNCQVNIDIRYPQNYSYAVTAVNADGYANVSNDLSLNIQSTAYFSGSVQQAQTADVIRGPAERPFSLRSPIFRPVWSKCNSNQRVNVNTALLLKGETKNSGLAVLDRSKIKIEWKAC
ncbi:hypothetical protein HDV02_006300 [Globomyces sp. JEL0801]|nr:hypothetical protein HDV02_006300 [Globomyces sp. JEL0801]